MKVFIIGTGNVAKSLGSAILRTGHQVTGIMGRNRSQGVKLADRFKCSYFSDASLIPQSSDIYILALKDDVIEEIANSLSRLKGIVVHTSGTTSLNVLKRFKNRGVVYPVESINGRLTQSFNNVPICLEAGEEKTLSTLLSFAASLSNKIFLLDSEQRATLHLAAVFTNNFTNHLLGIATEILDKSDLPHELLEKLAYTTVKNVFKNGALQSQTGPARRNDKVTIEKHLSLLKNDKDHLQVYRLITRQITTVHNNIKKRKLKS